MGGRGRGRGGNKRGRTQRRDFRDGRPNVWKKSRPEGGDAPGDAAAAPDGDGVGSERSALGWETFVMESSAFETYYKKQEVVPAEEWSTFIDTLRKPLPSSFRINASGQFAQNIRAQLQHDFLDLLKGGIEVDGEIVEPIKPLDWYPHNLAWVLQASRMQLRKLPLLERIHEFLKQENEIGSITRQEVVSMIPPLVLDVQPHHRVLDMCAAPGSKTFQLLEMIHKDDKPGLLPEGMVVANDLDVQRCHLLIHQTRRMCSPNILVTNHEGQHFPGLKRAQSNKKDVAEDDIGLLFDRILCDVPCSGDGTLRKAPDMWKKWHSGLGNGVHRLQIQIAMRGVALLKVGGRLVYSTCSLNPIEDEAVVGEILRQSEGSLELIDVSSEIPGLKYRPGLRSWKVRDKRKWLCSSSEVDRHRAGAIVPSMFPTGTDWSDPSGIPESAVLPKPDSGLEGPPEDSNANASAEEAQGEEIADEAEAGEAEVSSLPLERCMRILPHDQNTGGFFIAVFHKVSTFKAQQKSSGKEKSLRHQLKKEKASIAAPAVIEESTSPPSEEQNDQEEEPEAVKADAMAVDMMIASDTAAGDGDMDSRETLADESDVISTSEKLEAELQSGTVGGSESNEDQALDHEGDEVGDGVTAAAAQGHNRGRLQQQGRWKGVDPVLLLEDEQVLESLISYYGIKDSFPLRGHLITRSDDISRLKRIYYVSKPVSDVIKLNKRSGGQLKITSAGLKIFERQVLKEGISHCAFRIASEGLPSLLPHMTKQIVYTTNKDFKLLLSSKAVPFGAFLESEFAAAIQEILPGCCVIILPKWKGDGEVDFAASIAVGCWRGRNNVSLLITKTEAFQFLQRLHLTEEDSIAPTGTSIGEEKPQIPGPNDTNDILLLEPISTSATRDTSPGEQPERQLRQEIDQPIQRTVEAETLSRP